MTAKVRAKILVVDDECALQTTLSQLLQQIGHQVRVASNGFSALTAIRRQAPEILISELNMPSMSGYELLSVVRRRFPAIQVIAMSGSYLSDDFPEGVAADAFYRKGTGLGPLLQIVHSMTNSEAPLTGRKDDSALPVWLSRSDPRLGRVFVMVPCRECMRTFPYATDAEPEIVQQAVCSHCSASVPFAIVRPSAAAENQSHRHYMWPSIAASVASRNTVH